MALLIMVLRKMLKSKWLVLCLLLGLITSVALVSSIPLYTQAVLQKSLIKEMENFQKQKNRFPGAYLIHTTIDTNAISKTVYELEQKGENVPENKTVKDFYAHFAETFEKQDRYIKEYVGKRIGLPVLSMVYSFATDNMKLEGAPSGLGASDKYARMEALSGLEEHIELVDGKIPREQQQDGVYETLVSESALSRLNIVLGKELVLSDVKEKWNLPPIKVKPVGVFKAKDIKDPYWIFFDPDIFSESFLVSESTFRKDFIEKTPTLLYFARWYYAFDYHSLTIGNLGHTITGHESITKDINDFGRNDYTTIDAPGISVIFYSYLEKSNQLIKMLWALNVPLLIMLFLYLFMISSLIIEREKNEIALLSSRGATKFQVVFGYALEGLMLGGIAIAIGPYIGMILTKLLGASSGFLEFTSRKAIPVELNREAYTYSIVAVGVSLITIVIPAFAASGTSIVGYKRRISRILGLTLWERSFVDLILIAIAAYGYYTFRQRQNIVRVTGAAAADIQIDPLMFLVPALFIIGIGLLSLRLYPLLIKLIYNIGKRFWSPAIYVTLTQVGRSLKGYHFLMIFLMITLSIGIFSAVAARTINLNSKEKIYYGTGSDMVLESLWEIDAPADSGPEISSAPKYGEILEVKKVRYFEPSYLQYAQLSGVENTAKVFKKDGADIWINGKFAESPQLMGIDPYDFGKVAWFRNGLLKHHINEYLNILAQEPSACLISSSLSSKYKIKPGDSIEISWKGVGKAAFNVYGVVDYWPSWNPNIKPNDKKKTAPMLVVANLEYIQNHIAIEPYEVWLKLKPDTKSKQVYEDIQQKNLKIINLTDTHQEIIELNNNPFLLAINGALTLGFIISGFVCFFGFLLFWILSISSRSLQFGIFRAMGLPFRQLISMIVWEQIFTSGASIIAGLFIGLVSSRLFVPFFQSAFDAYSQVPPFKVISYTSDRLKVYQLLGTTMIACLAILGLLLSRIKISQAIKLGED